MRRIQNDSGGFNKGRQTSYVMMFDANTVFLDNWGVVGGVGGCVRIVVSCNVSPSATLSFHLHSNNS